jgi:hypothetical protein
LCGEKVYNILEEYKSHISNDSEIEVKFDSSSDSGVNHVGDIALGEVVSKIDIKGEHESNEEFLWKK